MSNQDTTTGFVSTSVCFSKNKILDGLKALEDIRKIIVLNNKVARIVIEETIVVKWQDIKKSINKLKLILPLMKNTVIWNIHHMKNLIEFAENNLNQQTISPCVFSDFLEKMLHRRDMAKNIRFLTYVLNDNVRCQRVFGEIK